jgi:hypothetical protein
VHLIPYKFNNVGNHYIRTPSKTKHTHENETKKRSATNNSQSITFPVNVANAAMAKQADYWLCGSTNRGTISKRAS